MRTLVAVSRLANMVPDFVVRSKSADAIGADPTNVSWLSFSASSRCTRLSGQCWIDRRSGVVRLGGYPGAVPRHDRQRSLLV